MVLVVLIVRIGGCLTEKEGQAILTAAGWDEALCRECGCGRVGVHLNSLQLNINCALAAS